MKHAVHLIKIGVVLTGTIWFVGCGVLGSGGSKKDVLSVEVETQTREVAELRAVADTLTNTRSRMVDDLNNLMELNKLSPEQVTVLEQQTNPPGDNLFVQFGRQLKKVGGKLKGLWPF